MWQAGAVLAPLRAPDYRRLWLAQTVSIVGDKIDQIAMSIVVYRITGSALQMGAMLAVTMLPSALFGLAVAPLVDRMDRRRTMIWSDLVRAGIVAIIPFAAGLDIASGYKVAAIYVLAFLVATLSLFFEPARLAMVPDIVPREALMAANSLDSTTSAVSELAGIAVGATLVATLGYRLAFALDAVSFLASALLIVSVAHRQGVRERSPLELGRLRAELVDGFRHIARQPVLRDLIRLYGVAALGASAAVALCMVLALDGFRSVPIPDALRLALIDTATTVGLVVGGILVGMSGSGRAGRKFLWGLVVFGGVFATASLVGDIWLSAIVLFVAGIANMFFQVPMVTLIQQVTAEEYRGRVFALRNALVRVVTVVGLLGAGVLADRVGVFAAMAIAGGLVFVVGMAGWTRPALREA